MSMAQLYRCIHGDCRRAPLSAQAGGFVCPNGHRYAYLAHTTIPVFAAPQEQDSDYSHHAAAEFHDNALRWLYATFCTSAAELRERLVSRLELQPGQKVLITGVGAGDDLPYVVRHLDGRGEIYAQDIAKEMLRVAAERHGADLAQDQLAIHFSLSDAMDLPFADSAFDAVYHFGGINLYRDIRLGIAEMVRVAREGGKVVFGDEGVAPWLVDTDFGRMLVRNNSLYSSRIPLDLLPVTAGDVRLSWELSNSFYVLELRKRADATKIDIDVLHVGRRGGSIRTRFEGELEGIDPELRERVYREAERRNVSRVELLEVLLRGGLAAE